MLHEACARWRCGKKNKTIKTMVNDEDKPKWSICIFLEVHVVY
jgi:hypothetical protein